MRAPLCFQRGRTHWPAVSTNHSRTAWRGWQGWAGGRGGRWVQAATNVNTTKGNAQLSHICSADVKPWGKCADRGLKVISWNVLKGKLPGLSLWREKYYNAKKKLQVKRLRKSVKELIGGKNFAESFGGACVCVSPFSGWRMWNDVAPPLARRSR